MPREGHLIYVEEKKQCDFFLKNSLLSSTMLLNLINDLLDLAKIENSQFKFNQQPFNLHEVIGKSVETLSFQALSKGIELSYKYDDHTAGYFLEVLGDENRYLQILLNFISNSLKFTPKDGKVLIEVKLVD